MVMVIVPAHNEEKNIGRVVRGLFEDTDLDRLGEDYTDYRVVVIDDGSDDRTGEIAKGLGATVLRHPINRGQGAALQTGNEYALAQGADMAVHFDADDQHNPADIRGAVLRLTREGRDVILGSRFLDARSRLPWFKRHVLLPVSRWINFVFTGVKLTDAHNGFRVLNRRALETIRITQDGMAHNSEIVAQIKTKGLAFAEHPVEVRYAEYGQGVRGGIKVIYDFLFGHFVT